MRRVVCWHGKPGLAVDYQLLGSGRVFGDPSVPGRRRTRVRPGRWPSSFGGAAAPLATVTAQARRKRAPRRAQGNRAPHGMACEECRRRKKGHCGTERAVPACLRRPPGAGAPPARAPGRPRAKPPVRPLKAAKRAPGERQRTSSRDARAASDAPGAKAGAPAPAPSGDGTPAAPPRAAASAAGDATCGNGSDDGDDGGGGGGSAVMDRRAESAQEEDDGAAGGEGWTEEQDAALQVPGALCRRVWRLAFPCRCQVIGDLSGAPGAAGRPAARPKPRTAPAAEPAAARAAPRAPARRIAQLWRWPAAPVTLAGRARHAGRAPRAGGVHGVRGADAAGVLGARGGARARQVRRRLLQPPVRRRADARAAGGRRAPRGRRRRRAAATARAHHRERCASPCPPVLPRARSQGPPLAGSCNEYAKLRPSTAQRPRWVRAERRPAGGVRARELGQRRGPLLWRQAPRPGGARRCKPSDRARAVQLSARPAHARRPRAPRAGGHAQVRARRTPAGACGQHGRHGARARRRGARARRHGQAGDCAGPPGGGHAPAGAHRQVRRRRFRV